MKAWVRRHSWIYVLSMTERTQCKKADSCVRPQLTIKTVGLSSLDTSHPLQHWHHALTFATVANTADCKQPGTSYLAGIASFRRRLWGDFSILLLSLRIFNCSLDNIQTHLNQNSGFKYPWVLFTSANETWIYTSKLIDKKAAFFAHIRSDSHPGYDTLCYVRHSLHILPIRLLVIQNLNKPLAGNFAFSSLFSDKPLL